MSKLKSITVLFFLLAVVFFGLSLKNLQNSNYAQSKEREMLITSYLRLADILKGLSSTICKEIGTVSSKNKDDITLSCEQMDSIIIKLKVAPKITEEERDHYNKLLINLTENLFDIAQKNKNSELAQKIESYKTDINKQMKIVTNKNLKLTQSINQTENQLQRYKDELSTARQAQKEVEERLQRQIQQYQAERDAAINDKRLLQSDLQKMQKEHNVLKNELKAATIEAKPKKIAETAPSPTPLPPPPLPVTTSENEGENLKNTKIATKDELKKQLTDDLMLFSEMKRNRELRQRLVEHFADPDAKTIQIDDTSYSIKEYADKLALLGPYNIAITDLKTDKQGKITAMKINETRLQK